MTRYEQRGKDLRNAAKCLVIDYMRSNFYCAPGQEGMTQSDIARNCGFDWGDYPKATSSQQYLWVVALLRELEAEGIVEHIRESGPWRLK